ncbi:hypothetical protein SEA_LUCKYSOCKE_154 [Streptomyces phage LuckySocke]|nr:hypothetical protein SEA_LUCKYSOCKE_154 [Streptomyces phage LuckySocke]
MEIIAYILAPFIASGAIYHLSKPILDSIWNAFLTALGKSGALGEEDMQNAVYHLVTKG